MCWARPGGCRCRPVGPWRGGRDGRGGVGRRGAGRSGAGRVGAGPDGAGRSDRDVERQCQRRRRRWRRTSAAASWKGDCEGIFSSAVELMPPCEMREKISSSSDAHGSRGGALNGRRLRARCGVGRNRRHANQRRESGGGRGRALAKWIMSSRRSFRHQRRWIDVSGPA